MKKFKIYFLIILSLYFMIDSSFALTIDEKAKILVNKNFITGRPEREGGLALDETITRAEVARLISAVKYSDEISNDKSFGKSKFKDVSSKHWANAYIAYSVDMGYISGYPDKTFRPNNKITYAEFISIIVRLQSDWKSGDYKNSSYWAKEFIDFAKDKNILEDVSIPNDNYDDYAKRGNVFSIIYNVVKRYEDSSTNIKDSEISDDLNNEQNTQIEIVPPVDIGDYNQNKNYESFEVVDNSGQVVKIRGRFLDFDDELLSLVNKHRAQNNVQELQKLDGEVGEYAKKRVLELVIYFSHSRPNPNDSELFKHFDTYNISGENIAKGQINPEDVMNSWMNSEGHRRNILDDSYSYIAQKAFESEDGTIYWVQLFVRRNLYDNKISYQPNFEIPFNPGCSINYNPSNPNLLMNDTKLNVVEVIHGDTGGRCITRFSNNYTDINTTPPSYADFDYWKIVSGDATIQDINSPNTIIYVNSENVIIEAVYKDKPKPIQIPPVSNIPDKIDERNEKDEVNKGEIKEPEQTPKTDENLNNFQEQPVNPQADVQIPQ